jgi:hypothetical protein
VEKAIRVGIPQGKTPKLFELKPLRFMRMDVVKCPSSKNERATW